MHFNRFQWQSLNTRATLFTLVIFVIYIGSLTFYTLIDGIATADAFHD